MGMVIYCVLARFEQKRTRAVACRSIILAKAFLGLVLSFTQGLDLIMIPQDPCTFTIHYE